MLEGMNPMLRTSLLLALSTGLCAQNRVQFGPHLNGFTLRGASMEGLEKPYVWLGGQLRFDLEQGHALQVIVGGTRVDGNAQQIFRIDDGYHYEVPLNVSLVASLVHLGAEYHYFPSRIMGQGFHAILGLGLAYSSLEKELPPHFDIPSYTVRTQTSPLVTLGVGYHFNRHLALSLRVTSFQGPRVGTQVDPAKGELDQGQGRVTLFSLGTSVYFR